MSGSYPSLTRRRRFQCLPSSRADGSPKGGQPPVQLKREQRFEPSPHFVEYAGCSLAYEPRSSLLPGGATQLICLDYAADHVTLRNRDLKAPLTIAPRDRASYTAARQLVEGALRKHERRAPSGLLVGDRLQE